MTVCYDRTTSHGKHTRVHSEEEGGGEGGGGGGAGRGGEGATATTLTGAAAALPADTQHYDAVFCFQAVINDE